MASDIDDMALTKTTEINVIYDFVVENLFVWEFRDPIICLKFCNYGIQIFKFFSNNLGDLFYTKFIVLEKI